MTTAERLCFLGQPQPVQAACSPTFAAHESSPSTQAPAATSESKPQGRQKYRPYDRPRSVDSF